MKYARIVMVISLLAAANAAIAGGQYAERGDLAPYFGLSVGVLRYQDRGASTFSPSVVLARVGLPITSYLGFEARLGTGLSSDDLRGYSVSVGSLGGAYLKGLLPVTPMFSLYGVAGIGSITLNRNFGDGDTTKTGLSFGFGGDVRLVRSLLLNFEWTHYPNGTDFGYTFNSNLLTAGGSWRF